MSSMKDSLRSDEADALQKVIKNKYFIQYMFYSIQYRYYYIKYSNCSHNKHTWDQSMFNKIFSDNLAAATIATDYYIAVAVAAIISPATYKYIAQDFNLNIQCRNHLILSLKTDGFRLVPRGSDLRLALLVGPLLHLALLSWSLPLGT